MSQIPSNLPIRDNAPATQSNDLRDVDVDQFLQLLIAELQNQDPLNPMDNAELLNQISQIREIGATNKLTETLDSVVNGQNLATAGNLIGKFVRALDDQQAEVTGVVERVSVAAGGNGSRRLRIHVDQHDISLENIREIVSAETE